MLATGYHIPLLRNLDPVSFVPQTFVWFTLNFLQIQCNTLVSSLSSIFTKILLFFQKILYKMSLHYMPLRCQNGTFMKFFSFLLEFLVEFALAFGCFFLLRLLGSSSRLG